MNLIESVIILLCGLLLGRWVNLSIDRLPRLWGASPVEDSPDSLPPIGFTDFIPLVSLWVCLRHCFHRNDKFWLVARPPGVEILTGITAAAGTYYYGLTPAAAILIFYCALFIHLIFVDLERSLILNIVVLPAIPMALVLFPFSPLGEDLTIGQAYLNSLTGAGVGFGLLLVVYIATKGGMGAGDVKLAALLGAILGFPSIIPGLLIGFTVGGVIGMAALVGRIKRRKDMIPFGPALVSGALAVLVGGASVYTWYLDLFRW